MKTKYLINLSLWSSLVASFFMSMWILICPVMFLLFIFLAQHGPFKLIRKWYWKLIFKEELLVMLNNTLNPILSYSMIIWVELGEAEQEFTTHNYNQFTKIVTDKIDDVVSNFVKGIDRNKMRRNFEDSLDWDEERFIDKVENQQPNLN